MVRWRAEDLEDAVYEDLKGLQVPAGEIADWFRNTLEAAFTDQTRRQRHERRGLKIRCTELKNMEGRLLNAYLSGVIDEGAFRAKSVPLRGQVGAKVMSLGGQGGHIGVTPGGQGARAEVSLQGQGDMALRLFDWTQRVADIWRGSNNGLRREILESICLNRTLSDVTLCPVWRKPFDVFAERPICHDGRGGRI